MGLKSILVLIFVVFVAIFSLQNLTAISLVFFSLKMPSLPLSFWMILSLLAGIISSLLVQILSGNSRRQKSYPQSFAPPGSQNPSPYSPPPPAQGKKERPSVSTSRLPVEDEFPEFEDLPDEVSQEYHPNPPTEFSPQKENNSFVDRKKSESTEDEKGLTMAESSSEANSKEENIKPVLEENEQPSKVVAETPSPALLKSREASPYSHQPREKTEIKTPISPPLNSDSQPADKAKSTNVPLNRDGIYDAPYRILNSRQNRPKLTDNPDKSRQNRSNIRDEQDEYWDDDDWDF